MSNKRAVIRREQQRKKKLLKNKSPQGEWMRAEQNGQRNGMVISFCTVTDTLFKDYKWDADRINEFSSKLTEQLLTGNPNVIEVAVVPWKDKLQERIKNRTKTTPKIIVKSALKRIEYENRNTSYISYCAYIFLNLYSNFNLSSNNKKTGTLDKLIDQCVTRFFQIMDNPEEYTSEKCLARTKQLTGLDIV